MLTRSIFLFIYFIFLFEIFSFIFTDKKETWGVLATEANQIIILHIILIGVS